MQLDPFFLKRIKYLFENNEHQRFNDDYAHAVSAVGGYDAPVTHEKQEVLSYLPMKWDIMALSGDSPLMLKDMSDFITANFDAIDLLYDMAVVMETYFLTYLLDDLIGVSDCKHRGVLAQKIRLANDKNDQVTKSELIANFDSIESIPDYEKCILIRVKDSENDLIFHNEHLVEGELTFLPHNSIQFYAKLCSPTHTATLKLPFSDNDQAFLDGELRVFNQDGDLQIYPINGLNVKEYLYSSPYGTTYSTHQVKIFIDNTRAFEVIDRTHHAHRLQLVTN